MMTSSNKAQVLERVRDLSHNDVNCLNEKMKIYAKWSTYDEDVDMLAYSADRHGVVALTNAVDTDSVLTRACSIVDFAAGTGRVGKKLREANFTGPIDAVDGCKEFLQKGQHNYRRTFCVIIKIDADLPAELRSGTYDAAIMCGAMSATQVEVNCLSLILAAIRVGGIAVFTTRTNQSNRDYARHLETAVHNRVSKGEIGLVFVRTVDEFELATSSEEASKDSKYIAGIIYCVKKLS
ncbi:unnamed protein product [Clavelina lepadiformis]|uniref:Methyltransferase domain-containing protein n=1 Tax=Clavelina lepadiformis TaxID=159417 RepID=A0ABP0FRC9_CLALP